MVFVVLKIYAELSAADFDPPEKGRLREGPLQAGTGRLKAWVEEHKPLALVENERIVLGTEAG